VLILSFFRSHKLYVLKMDLKTGGLHLAGEVNLGTGVFALQQDKESRLWVMGESPRVQVLKVSINAAGKVESKPQANVNSSLEELNNYLEAHGKLFNFQKHCPYVNRFS
jgi:hypothetical protein